MAIVDQSADIAPSELRASRLSELASWLVRRGTVVLVVLGPLLAVFVVNIAFPFFNQGVFMAGLKLLDPARAEALATKPGMPIPAAMWIATVRLGVFLGLSVVFFLIGLILLQRVTDPKAQAR